MARQQTTEAEAGLTRRQALKRGLLVGGATVWGAAVVQSIALTPAAADTPSGVEVGGIKMRQAPSGGGPGTAVLGEKLAATGSGFPVVPAVAAGTGLVAGGAVVAHLARSRGQGSADADAVASGSQPGEPAAPGQPG